MLEETRAGSRMHTLPEHRAGYRCVCPAASEGKHRGRAEHLGSEGGFRAGLSLPRPQGGLTATPQTTVEWPELSPLLGALSG